MKDYLIKEKRTILIVGFFLICSILFASTKVNAETIVASGVCGTDGNNVMWTLDEYGILTFSGFGKMSDFSSEEELPWKDNTVTKLKIESGVTNVGSHICLNNTQLESVSLADSVREIGESAFCGCKALTSIDLPSNLEKIRSDSFRESGLTSVVIPGTVKNIEDAAFYANFNLESVTMKDGVVEIGDYAFCESSKLKNISFSNTLETIGNNAFTKCSELEEVKFPNSLTDIKGAAFRNTKLKKGQSFFLCDSSTADPAA